MVFAAASLQNAFEDIGRLHSAAGGAPGPVQSVRVTSVVPSRYCAPESIR